MWDEQIDDVARQMTEGDVPADLRVRVLGRLEAHSERGPRWIWMVSSAAVATAILLVIALLRNPQDRGAVETQPYAPPSAQTRAPGDAGSLTQPFTPLLATGQFVRPQTASGRQPSRSARSMADFMVESLPAPDSIALTSLELPALAAADPITTEPIAIAALELRPIDEPAANDQ